MTAFGGFLVTDEQLASLRSTRQGRTSLGGYNYQCSYAVARLASMLARRPVLGLEDWPTSIRYDWGEDLDEVSATSQVWFTQCKRVGNIGDAFALARVLVGFAPKWLWIPSGHRTLARFRLVAPDRRFVTGGALSDCAALSRDDVAAQFVQSLRKPPKEREDRASWQALADDHGHEALFDALWTSAFLSYLPGDELADDPAGRILPGERQALDLLLRHDHISARHQAEALARLRRLVHDNLIEFAPASARAFNPPERSPRLLQRADVALALFVDRPASRFLPFSVVDQVYLSTQREKTKAPFVARAPEWADVIHGADDSIKFVERDQTHELKGAIQQHLVKPIAQGASDLGALFVSGPPGAGKSTLVRRVGALLVDEGSVVIADAGLNLGDPPEDLNEYCEHLIDLAEAGRPVLLMLDDPLFEDSGWVDLLHGLKRPGLRIAVLAATPRFLFDRFKNRLGKLRVHEFKVLPASPAEKASLARAFGRDANTFGAETDDFLALSMQAGAGEPFDTLMDRLWTTLSGGVTVGGPDLALDELSWPSRAFLIVCFFHRCGLPCPEPLLQAALQLSGGTGTRLGVCAAVEQLKYAEGWRIVRLIEACRSNWEYEGSLIATSHQSIAERAWARRPMPWLDGELCAVLAQASTQAQQTARSVGIAAGTLKATSSVGSDGEFLSRIISHWSRAAASPTVETRNLCVLAGMLQRTGCVSDARRLSDVLLARATPGPDGWLAALALWWVSSDVIEERSWTPAVDMEALISAADFAIAPNRAVHLASRLSPRGPLITAFRRRLLESLDRTVPWRLDSYLLTWLLASAQREALAPRMDAVRRWLEDHPADTSVRTQYLSCVLRLPKECEEDRRHAVADTVRWLNGRPADTSVRAQYLSFLLQLPKEFDPERRQAAAQTAMWLAEPEHSADTRVRAQYLSFLLQLPKEFDPERRQAAVQTAAWLAEPEHSADTSVRAQYLSFLLQLPKEADPARRDAAIETAKWLAAPEHDPSAILRTQFLSFLAQLPKEYGPERRQASTDTAKWLAEPEHADNTSVRAQYLSFLLHLPEECDPERRQAAFETAKWLAEPEHADDTSVRTQYLSFLGGLPRDEPLNTLRWRAAEQVACWLRQPENAHVTDVRAEFLGFLSRLPSDAEPLRRAAALEIAAWLGAHEDDYHVRAKYLWFILDLSGEGMDELRRDSEGHFAYLIAETPAYHGTHRLFGEMLLRLERYGEAAVQFREALALRKGHQLAHHGLGMSLQRLGQYSAAEWAFRDAIRWAKRHEMPQAMFFTSLGWFYIERRRWDEAIGAFRSAQLERPDYFGNHWGIAKAMKELGDYGHAEMSLRKALETPDLPPPARDEVPKLLIEIRRDIRGR